MIVRLSRYLYSLTDSSPRIPAPRVSDAPTWLTIDIRTNGDVWVRPGRGFEAAANSLLIGHLADAVANAVIEYDTEQQRGNR